jgi:very-short-patch-repair endonuclease
MINDDELRALAKVQHGIVGYEQMRTAGFTYDQRRRLVATGRWEVVHGRTLRLVGSSDTGLQELATEVLAAGPGAGLCGDTALFHWGGRGAVRDPIRVARPRDRIGRGGVGLGHKPTLLPSDHIVVLDGIPVVTPSRAIFDVAGAVVRGADKPWHLDRVERLIGNAVTDRLMTKQSLFHMLDDMAQRGRPGIKVMRVVLDKIDWTKTLPASGLETRVVQICRTFGLPAMRRQVNVGDSEGWIGRVDFVADDLPFILEVQSDRFHASDIDRQFDADRIRRLTDAGFVVAEVTETQVWHHAEEVAAIIREGRRRAAARPDAAGPATAS